MAQATDRVTLSYRLSVTARILAAVIGGYILTSLFVIVLALLWPIPQAQAVVASTMLSFLVYTLIIMWAFSVRQLRTVWVGLLSAIIVFGLLAWILLPEAG